MSSAISFIRSSYSICICDDVDDVVDVVDVDKIKSLALFSSVLLLVSKIHSYITYLLLLKNIRYRNVRLKNIFILKYFRILL